MFYQRRQLRLERPITTMGLNKHCNIPAVNIPAELNVLEISTQNNKAIKINGTK